MKKIFSILFCLAAFAVILAFSSEAETQVNFYVAPSGSAENAQLTAEHGAEFVGFNIVNVLGKIRTYVASYPINENGNLVQDGAEKEIRVYMTGTTSSSSSGSSFTASTAQFFGSDGENLPLIRVTSLDPEAPAVLYRSNTTSGGQETCNFQHNFAFDHITITTKCTASATKYWNKFCLGTATRLVIGEGVVFRAENTSDTVLTNDAAGNGFVLFGGSALSSTPAHAAEITVLSGAWDSLNFMTGYKNDVTEATVTVGGDARIGALAGVAVMPAAGASAKDAGTVSGNARVRICGGAVTDCYAGFVGTSSDLNALAVTGNIETTVEGSASVARYFGGLYAGSLTGNVCNNIRGGAFTGNFQYGASNTGSVSGTVTNRLSGGGFANRFFGGSVSGTAGSIVNEISGAFSCKSFYGGGNGGAISGSITNDVSGGSFETNFCGAGLSGDTLGSVTNTVSGGSFQTFTGGSYSGSVSGDVSTSLSGSALIQSFYGAGYNAVSVCGSVSVAVSGGTVSRSFAAGSHSADTVFAEPVFAVTLDLTDADIRLCSALEENASVTLTGGAGSLTLLSASSLSVSALSGTPRVISEGKAGAGTVLLTLPEGAAETAVIFESGSAALFLAPSFVAQSLSPVGSTVILRDDGVFALRILFPRKEAEYLIRSGSAPTFSYSVAGGEFLPAELGFVVIDGVRYASVVIDGISAKAVGEPVTLSSSFLTEDDVYSVAEACRDVLASPESGEKMRAFAGALLDYGRAAYLFFDCDGAAPGDAYLADVDAPGYTDPYADVSSSVPLAGASASIAGTSVSVKDGLFLNFYVRVTDGAADPSGWILSVEGKALPLVRNGSFYKASYPVPADQMDRTVAAVVLDGNGAPVSNTYSDSVTSYCAFAAGNASDPAHTAVCRYLQRFVKAASELFFASSAENDPAADGVLRVLLVGNSFCMNFTDELYGMLNAAGVRASIANVYYGGCRLEQHWNWTVSGEANYTYYVHDEEHPSAPLKITNADLSDCLDAQNWDVISLQQHFKPDLTQSYETALASCTPYAADLTALFRETHPLAEYRWHETWAWQVDPSGTKHHITSLAAQTDQYEVIRDVSARLCLDLGMKAVLSGDAWQFARANPLIGDTLCSDDLYHDGDSAGGQYLNACVWFEALTGVSCVGNLYRPSYSLGEGTVLLLQCAAHEAGELSGIPVPTPEMSEDELRAVAAEEMARGLTVLWTPDEDVTYVSANIGKTITLESGRYYSGMPYTTAGQDRASFLDHLDPVTRVLSVSDAGGEDFGAFYGNHCSTSAFWAWSRVSASFQYRGNSVLTLDPYSRPVGSYHIREGVSKYGYQNAEKTEKYDTADVCAENGEQTMYESYAAMKQADGLLTFKTDTTGHVRMVQAAPSVVRLADGTIDGSASRVILMEQVSTATEKQAKNGVLYDIGKVGVSVTFRELFRDSYLPFTIAEFCGEAAPEAPRAWLNRTVSGGESTVSVNGIINLSDWSGLKARSNLAVSRLDVSVTTSAGAEAAHFSAQGYGSELVSGKGARRINFSQFDAEAAFSDLASGTYDLTLVFRLADGEELTRTYRLRK